MAASAVAAIGTAASFAFVGIAPAVAQEGTIHPTFPLLDRLGSNVLESGGPVSTMVTCGGCHDTEYIADTSYHSDVGLGAMSATGSNDSLRPWDSGPGYFGRWDPTTYRYLTPSGDQLIDLGTAEWVWLFGARHVGGGPAETGRDGTPLEDMSGGPHDPETNVMNRLTGAWQAFDWQESGTAELNCFMCHIPEPDNEARMQALAQGDIEWASTATLAGTGLVKRVGDEARAWRWQSEAFDESGDLPKALSAMRDPGPDNCGACHGLVHADEEPILNAGCKPDHWSTERTGQIVSPHRMADSGMNLADKKSLSRSWDVHAERLVSCVDCHYSENNPIYRRIPDNSPLDHLAFDARRLDIADYLYRPSHQLARGTDSDAKLRCVSCHLPSEEHDWLPYKDRHFAALACESCHIPQMYAPARRQFDWTVLTTDGEARIGCRGVEGEGGQVTSLITGFEPVLLPREAPDGSTSLAPHNLITSWYWVYDDPPRPVRQHDLSSVYLADGEYHDDIVALLDADGDANISTSELALDSADKVEYVMGRLEDLGLSEPRVVGEIQPYAINHGVTHGEWATSACEDCHKSDSRITRPFLLATYLPAGVQPELVPDSATWLSGDLRATDDGGLELAPVSAYEDLYVIGHDRLWWIGWLGALGTLGVLLGVTVHGGLRAFHAMRREHEEPEVERVYMYTTYERAWHWLQALVIGLLIVTGFVIHTPDLFGAFNYQVVVIVHNVLGFVLLANAALAVFYHVAGGGIRRFLPEPKGFFNQAIVQVTFYMRGIMRGDEHPFEKNPTTRLNPLQQVTYLVILNVLLPLQVITGVLIWGAQRWPGLTDQLGGLWVLAPIHTLVSWLFLAFLILHMYLTTTGHTPTASIEAMIVGWEDVEVHGSGVVDEDQPAAAGSEKE